MTDLARFHQAQNPVIDTVLAELAAGQKRSHWMWFIFPQLRSLGRSPTAKFFGVYDLTEARAYLADPILHERLETCAATMLDHDDKSATQILGPIDVLKLRSSMTLFSMAGGAAIYTDVLSQFYHGETCPLTVSAITAN
jgi:uncharacterized protein (DUF1810 family)